MIIGKINFLARHWYQMKRRFVHCPIRLIGQKVKDPVIFQEELDMPILRHRWVKSSTETTNGNRASADVDEMT